MLLVNQGLLILPEQLSSSWVLVGFSEVRVPQYLVFCVVVCRSLSLCPFSLFLSAIVLSGLRLTVSALFLVDFMLLNLPFSV